MLPVAFSAPARVGEHTIASVWKFPCAENWDGVTDTSNSFAP
jgi:hypothetical protein